MRVRKLEFGKWIGQDKWPLFENLKGACGCRIFTVGPFYLTILGKECYDIIIKEEKQPNEAIKKD